MTEFDPSTFDDRLEAYLDGVMADAERAEFEVELNQNPQLGAEVALQAQVDSALARAFPEATATTQHLAALEKHWEGAAREAESLPLETRWPWIVGILSTAAAACLSFAFWSPGMGSRIEPHFEPTPLAQVYAETVNSGFEPYYECRDEERFGKHLPCAQGVGLRLTKLPIGSIMKGLSYPGGLSRETTAMLCEVKGIPVMVFVDRQEKDLPQAAKNSDPQVNVFRAEHDGLVFYEVTPLSKPTMTEHLVAIAP